MMDARKDGGPAFPTEPNTQPGVYVHHGMTLRDYFAASVLTAFDGNPNLPDDPATPRFWPEPAVLAERRAQWAYLQADAMLAERSK